MPDVPKEVAKGPLDPKLAKFYLDELEREGFRVTKEAPRERVDTKLDVKVKPGGILRLGLSSDPHTSSRYQQITHLTDFYRYCDERGAQAFLDGGDTTEGIHHAHRDAVYHQFNHGTDAQVRYAVKALPRSKNGKTYRVSGNHDAWAFEQAGTTTSELICKERPNDDVYLGYYAAFVEVGGLRIYLAHGAKGGGSYGKSYKPQRLIEQMAVEEREKTHLAFFGHWHTDLYLGKYQGVFTWSLPCFQSQTPFLRSIGKSPTIGGLFLEVEFTRDMKVWDVRQDWRYYSPLLNDYPGAG